MSLMRKYFCNLFDFNIDNFPSTQHFLFCAVACHFHRLMRGIVKVNVWGTKKATIHIHYIFFASTFRGRPEHLQDERQSEEQHDSTDEEEAIVIVQLSNRVQDGTRCRPGSLDICIQGKCQVRTAFQNNGQRETVNLFRQMAFINIRYLISLAILNLKFSFLWLSRLVIFS